MELMTSWTDERMDDLKHQVDELDRRMDAGFRELREEMRAHQRETNARFDAMNTEMNARFDSLQRTMIQFGGAMIAAMAGLFAAQLGLILTQL
jgi:hypothetical protein